MKTNIGILVNMTGLNIVDDIQSNAMTALAAAILRGCPRGWSVEAERGVITVSVSTLTDPRDPRPDNEMIGRDPIFRAHNCARCDSGRRPCIKGDPSQCDLPHARND